MRGNFLWLLWWYNNYIIFWCNTFFWCTYNSTSLLPFPLSQLQIWVLLDIFGGLVKTQQQALQFLCKWGILQMKIKRELRWNALTILLIGSPHTDQVKIWCWIWRRQYMVFMMSNTIRKSLKIYPAVSSYLWRVEESWSIHISTLTMNQAIQEKHILKISNRCLRVGWRELQNAPIIPLK